MSNVPYRIDKSFENEAGYELEISEFPEYKPDIRLHQSDGMGMVCYEIESKEQLEDIINYLFSVKERWS